MKFSKQKKLCVTQLKKDRKKYCKDFKLSEINGSKKFWKKIKHFLGNRVKENNVITLIERNKLIIYYKNFSKNDIIFKVI